MKIMLAAIAIATATPALAQTAPTPPAANAHAGHSAPAGTATHADHTGGHASGHEGHDMAGDCCEQAKAKGKKMACCEKAAPVASTETPPADPHAGHGMSQR